MATVYTEQERVRIELALERRKAQFINNKRDARRRIEELEENREIAEELGLNPDELEDL